MTNILRATPDQAEAFRQIARASKQHWGYSPDYMQVWNHEQSLTPDFILNHPVYYAVVATAVAGFYALDMATYPCELKHLWIAPNYIGQGIGKRLFAHLTAFLEHRGVSRCQILAEPHAEGFYQHMGAVKIDQKVLPHLGQVLPIMELKLPVKPGPNRPVSEV